MEDFSMQQYVLFEILKQYLTLADKKNIFLFT